MKLNRVLIIFKKTGPGTGPTVKLVKKILEKSGIKVILKERENLKSASQADLIISAGGDGTFLAAAHVAKNTPVLGLNSQPGHSVGFFCAADIKNFDYIIEKIIGNRIRPKKLPLIEARIGTKLIPHLALNDILFAGDTPAETVRYKIICNGKTERQKSSGIWIAAGPGSTAAIFSAGGRQFPISSRKLQFIVREPYYLQDKNFRLVHEVLKPGSKISVISEMKNGMIYIDGHKIFYPIKHGERLNVQISKKTLTVFFN